ncbi:hypothetical protein ACH4SP_19845 [Streptomyces sp. NPDC021093]|uniref:hypothetical protein n=1 Tax=Streptomyces sp. NPDC021093 TaxID=3365112 RepID=UPI003787ACBA
MRSSTARPRRSRLTGAAFAAAALTLSLGGTAYAAEEPPLVGESAGEKAAENAGESASEKAGENAAESAGENLPLAAEDAPLAAEDPLLAGEDPLLAGEEPLLAGEEPLLAGEDSPPAGQLEFNPATVAPGSVVTVNTTACGPGGQGTGHASSLGIADFTMETSTHKEVLVGQFTVPAHTAKGEYAISVSCADGRKSAAGDLWVTAGSPTDPSPTTTPTSPTGHVRTGVGGSVSAPDTPQIAAGAAVLAASAVGGTWLLRRRASGER